MSAGRRHTLRNASVAGAFVFVLAGCAALRIDVDVYKGPLANHEDVQVRQYAALAVAARPVLAALRNRLEERKSKGFTNLLAPEERDDFILDRVGDRFKSEPARMINGALSFYRDASALDIDPTLNDMKLAVRRLQTADRQYHLDEKTDLALGDLVEKAGTSFDSAKQKRTPEEIRSSVTAFAHSLARFLRGEGPDGGSAQYGREEGQVWRACTALAAAAGKLRPAQAKSLPWAAARLECAKTESANDIFGVMAKATVVEVYSNAIFGELQPQFAERIATISRAFIARREEIRAMLLSSLGLMEGLAARGGSDDQRRAAAAIVAELIQPRHLACYFTGALDRGENQRTLERMGFSPIRTAALLETLGNPPSALMSKWPAAWTDRKARSYLDSKNALAEAGTLYPLEQAALLRHADGVFKSADDSKFTACTAVADRDRSHSAPRTTRAYGLARGPTLDVEFREIIAEVSASLQTIAQGSAAGFEYARLQEGLDTLTRKFLIAMSENGNDPRNERVVAARKRLEETLIVWAERVLVAINNRAMLPPAGPDDADAEKQAREVAVLEAVGNNILVHADDVRRREAHERRLERRAGPEERAIRQAFDLTAAQTLDNLMRNLRADIDRLSKEAVPSAPAADGKDPVAAAQEAVQGKAAERQQADAAATAVVTAKTTIFRSLLKPPPKLDKRALELISAIEAEVGKLQSGTTTANVLAVIVKAVGDAQQAATTTPAEARAPWGVRLTRTKEYLAETKDDYANVTGKDGADILVRLSDKFERTAEQKLETAKALAKEEAGLQRTFNDAKAKAQVAAKATDFAAVRDVLIELRGEILKKADASGIDAPRSLLALLADTLRAKADEVKGNDAAATDRKRILGITLKVVQDTTPPRAPVLSEARPGEPRRTQKDLVDDVLALLRMQRTQALAAGESGRAKNNDEAIKRLYEDRADLAYLRPASAYLRSVYASTAYQPASDVGWVNMIARNTGRAFSAGETDPYRLEYLRTLQQIDKQHWQTINTVNLAGGGKTNYVLTKDDVGNWYLKNYSADPEAIFRSAQGLALFGLGKGLDMNLLRRAQLQRELSTATDSSEKSRIGNDLRNEESKEGKPGGAALGRVYLRYREDYEDQTWKDTQDLRDTIAALAERLNGAWSKALGGTTLEAMLQDLKKKYASETKGVTEAQASVDVLDASLKAGDTAGLDRKTAVAAAEERARAILRSLESMRRLRVRLQLAIQNDDELVKPYRDSADSAERDKLGNAVQNRTLAATRAGEVLGELIAQKAGRRLETVDRLERAVAIVGEAGP